MTKNLSLAIAVVAALIGATSLRADGRAPTGPSEDGTLPALTKIAGQGQMNSHAFGFLTELSDDIGARVTGSANDRKAQEWGAAKMKSIGLDNVQLESFHFPRHDLLRSTLELSVAGTQGRIEGGSLRLYGSQSGQWSLNYANLRNGLLTSPVYGRFDAGGRGLFYGPDMLDGSRPSDFESTSDSVPCQLFDIRFVPVMVTPLYRLYSPATFVIWNTLRLNGVSSLNTDTVLPLASTP